ncbi:translation initiation factor IF-3 [Gelria sp. Kuro-4]|uniref:translation initiation factor IF-3 n=1 Tax=Gelria sp. Kuro-4 TaxID=2796927 RepID=UPI00351D29B2
MTKDLQVNEQIRVREVRLVDETGQQLGIMLTREALRLAQEKGLDLVKVAPDARPPVCRIMDFGRYKYEQSKREKEARKKQKVITIKEIRLRPTIDEHDYEVKLRNMQRFLSDGDKVKVTVRFRGRQMTHTEAGRQLLARMAEQLKDLGTVEREPRLEGNQMIMILAPRSEEKGGK